MDNDLKFDVKKYLPSTLIIYSVGLMMGSHKILSKRLKAIGLYGWTGEYFKEYKERVLKSLYTNNERKMKRLPIRLYVLLKKWRRAL